nr:hypothetical protein CFP56_64542 [Quercus suber]
MVLEKKTPDLLVLPTTHAGRDSPVVSVVHRPPTPIPPLPSCSEAVEKKRKRGRQSGKESSEEVEILPTSQQAPSKEPRLTRAQQKKGPSERASKGIE